MKYLLQKREKHNTIWLSNTENDMEQKGVVGRGEFCCCSWNERTQEELDSVEDILRIGLESGSEFD